MNKNRLLNKCPCEITKTLKYTFKSSVDESYNHPLLHIILKEPTQLFYNWSDGYGMEEQSEKHSQASQCAQTLYFLNLDSADFHYQIQTHMESNIGCCAKRVP